MTNSMPRPAAAVQRRLRRAFPHRRVVREVQGVTLVLPWAHKLPDYAEAFPRYGQNLVELAGRLGLAGTPLGVVDIGANVGDSALQILAVTDAKVLCVEADDYWLKYLHQNVDHDPRIVVVPAFLSTADKAVALAPVRTHGTTRFEAATTTDTSGPAVLNPRQLKDAYPQLGPVRLIKSDTDGFDTRIIPRAAAAWSADRPVLFFEFDPDLTRQAGDAHPEAVWDALAALGYRQFGLWDNFGQPLGMVEVGAVEQLQAVLDQSFESRGYHYWDVAAFHEADEVGRQAVTELVGDAVAGAPRLARDG